MLGALLGVAMCFALVLFLWFIDRGAGVGILEPVPTESFNAGRSQIGSEPRAKEKASSLPGLIAVEPVPGSEISQFERVRLWFPEPVVGVSKAGLTCNGRGAIGIQGEGAGPYVIPLASHRQS